MNVDMNSLRSRERYAWMIASIVPRPIAFVSTLSAEGVANLAPFSFFNGVCSEPPIVSIAIGAKRGGVPKDTLRNVEATGELVISIVTEAMAEAMVLCSGDWPPDVSEFDVSGFTKTDSRLVRPPRVAESPLSFECRLIQVVRVGTPPTGIVLAEILTIHADDEILTDGMPDARKFQPLARLGGAEYAGLGGYRTIARPVV